MALFQLDFGESLSQSAEVEVCPEGITVTLESGVSSIWNLADSVKKSQVCHKAAQRLAAALGDSAKTIDVFEARKSAEHVLVTMQQRWIVDGWLAFRELRSEVPPKQFDGQTTNVLILELYGGLTEYQEGDWEKATVLCFVQGNYHRPEQATAHYCPDLQWCFKRIDDDPLDEDLFNF